MTDHPTARAVVSAYLQRMEARMNASRTDRPASQLVIVEEREHDFGWVFFWNTKQFVDTGDHRFALAGNTPLIVDRHDGLLYAVGTARSLEQSLEQYRKGVRHRAQAA